MNLTGKTKEELIKLVEQHEDKIHELENDVDYWQKEYEKMEEIKDDLDNMLDELQQKDGIKNLEWFIFRLKLENLYTSELEQFIENYCKFHNK